MATKPKYRAEIFEGENGDWYWRILAKNGNEIACAGEGYKNKTMAKKMLNVVIDLNNSTFGELLIEILTDDNDMIV